MLEQQAALPAEVKQAQHAPSTRSVWPFTAEVGLPSVSHQAEEAIPDTMPDSEDEAEEEEADEAPEAEGRGGLKGEGGGCCGLSRKCFWSNVSSEANLLACTHCRGDIGLCSLLSVVSS